MKWTELPVFRNGLLERAFFLAYRKVARKTGEQRVFDFARFGFDVSYYQGAIDFKQMRDFGASFVILRAGQGNWKDKRFDEYINSAAMYLPVSVYHFYDPVYHPTEQANSLLAALEPYTPYVRRVWLDFEYWWNGTYATPANWKFYRDIIKWGGYEVGTYTRATWWDSRVGNYAAEFAADPLWAAQYHTSLTLIPKGWTKATLWQSGTPSVGAQAGVSSSEIDRDEWNSDFDFAAEWGTPTLPTQDGGTTMEWKVTAESLKVRSGSSINYGQVQSLFAGDVVTGVLDAATNWINISKITRVNGVTLAPAAGQWWCSGAAAYVTLIPPEPEPQPAGHVVRVLVDEVEIAKVELS